MNEITPAKSLDVKNLSCPLPVLKAKKALKELEIGQILEIIATDPGSTNDIPAWTRSTGQELVDQKEENGVYYFYVKRLK